MTLKEAKTIVVKELKKCGVRIPQKPPRTHLAKYSGEVLKMARNDFARELRAFRDYQAALTTCAENMIAC